MLLIVQGKLQYKCYACIRIVSIKVILAVICVVVCQLELAEGVVYYSEHACDAAYLKPGSDARRHADNGWYNTAVNADGFHCPAYLPRANRSL